MKYNISINQLAWQTICPDADIRHSSIFEVIKSICNSKNPKLKKTDDGFTWISSGLIINELPMLKIKSKGGITKILKQLQEWDFIEIKKDLKTNKNYFQTTLKSEQLERENAINYDQKNETKKGGAVYHSKRGCLPQYTYPITIDPSTKEQEIPSLKKSTLKMDASVLEKEQKKSSKEVKRDNTKIAEFISSSTDLPVRQCYAHAGKMIKQYGYELTLSIISKIETADISYIYGALRSQAENNGDFEYANQSIIQNLASMCEG